MIVPYLANLFHVALSEKRIPACWKKAKISPLYKKGSKLDPNNYRMLAVSGTLYRLYANILRELVTKWCVENRKVPDTQFGFYPDRSTIQPIFILRHLVHAAKQIQPKGCFHLHTAFIDFKQAYDTIDRPHLWAHLNNIRMPTLLVNFIKQMYDGDEYVLIDDAKTTGGTGNSAVPLRGVKTRLSFISSPLFPFYQ